MSTAASPSEQGSASPDEQPTVHRWRDRVRPAVRCASVGLVIVAVAGILSEVLSLELVTATLAPTVYHLASAPTSLSSRRRNLAGGHGIALLLGLATAEALRVQPVTADGEIISVKGVVAAGITLALTLLALELADLHHPPAAATGLLVSSGLVPVGWPLLGLVLGLVLAVLLAPPLTRWVQQDVLPHALRDESGRQPRR